MKTFKDLKDLNDLSAAGSNLNDATDILYTSTMLGMYQEKGSNEFDDYYHLTKGGLAKSIMISALRSTTNIKVLSKEAKDFINLDSIDNTNIFMACDHAIKSCEELIKALEPIKLYIKSGTGIGIIRVMENNLNESIGILNGK